MRQKKRNQYFFILSKVSVFERNLINYKIKEDFLLYNALFFPASYIKKAPVKWVFWIHSFVKGTQWEQEARNLLILSILKLKNFIEVLCNTKCLLVKHEKNAKMCGRRNAKVLAFFLQLFNGNEWVFMSVDIIKRWVS